MNRRIVLWPWQLPAPAPTLQVVAVANPALETVWVTGREGTPIAASPQAEHDPTMVIGFDLIVRVIASVVPEHRVDGHAVSPRARVEDGAIVIDAWPSDTVDRRDPRLIVMKTGIGIRLPSISHLRRVRFDAKGEFVAAQDVVLPDTTPYEVFGKEDPSVTWLDGQPYLSYVGVSDWGITPVLARGEAGPDGWVYTRVAESQGTHDNRDIKILPVRPGGNLWRHDRVNTLPWGPKRMTWATSPDDGVSWSASRPLLEGRFDWERHHVGAGAVPFEATGPDGEPVLASCYHGVHPHPEAVAGVYQTGLALFDATRPDRLLGRLERPLITAWADQDFHDARKAACPYDEAAFTERHEGFVIPQVVFTTGHTRRGDRQWIWSGVNDFAIELADLPSLADCLTTHGYTPEPD